VVLRRQLPDDVIMHAGAVEDPSGSETRDFVVVYLTQ
jgi:hypothetical protein